MSEAGIGEKRTTVRWKISILMWAVIAINFVDRTNLSAAAPVLEKQFHISPAEMGVVMSSFFWSYVVFMIPSGWLADKIGQRISLALSCLWWSLATAATALVRSAGSLIWIRLIMGIGESGAYPANAGITSKWFPVKERARVAGIFDSGNKVGAALAMPLVVWLLTRFGWEIPFIVSGVLGFIWVTIWWVYYRDPEKHRYVNQAELTHIRAGQPQDQSDFSSRVKWYHILCHRNIISMCIAFFMLNYTSYFFITQLSQSEMCS
ncbi:MFS transporter [Alicyclobacillus fastidiosus]|uniref:MFS transporter n=1 Tax=Alicyclobacillus fastidiosus TaxID=392011 RepID=A0ABY6ZFU8_9BACL|nr:MFS transporter [Alicyclobacillus fastidiosus]WAH41783.1 MFS transporter [Alicyclobacillus fastidiosus]GMA63478.1 hypothetical protein GCM10025859_39180 [Alicyclobacillus fastidiosus]